MSAPGRLCTFPGCDREFLAKGFCRGHYMQHTRGVELMPLRRVMPGASIAEKIAAYSEPMDGCLVWTRGRDSDGYGRVTWDGRTWLAHRAAYTLEHGPIPDERQVNHICGNPPCVEKSHLELVTHQQNGEYRTRLASTNTSGYRGVHYDKQDGRYHARVYAGGVLHFLGLFATAEEAAEAAAEGRARLHSMPEFGDRFVTEGATR